MALLTSSPLLLLRRYPHLLRRYRERPMSFTRRKAAFYRAYWAYAAERIGAEVHELGNDVLQVRRGRRRTHVRFHEVDLDTFFKKKLVDDKALVSRLVRELGFHSPASASYSLREMEPALEFLAQAGAPCVVKPVTGSGGRGITTGITTRARLVEASLHASTSFQVPPLMIETQQPGESYRLLYLEGRLLHAVQRGRPTVAGDGVSSLRALIAKENARRQNDLVLHSIAELTADLEARYCLADQGLSLSSVPPAGERVAVKNVSNQNSRRDQSDVTARVHPDYHRFAERVFERLGAHLLGVDVMSTDVSRSPLEAKSAILELNIPAGLHYHELVAGQDGFSGVGAAILDYALFTPAERERRKARHVPL